MELPPHNLELEKAVLGGLIISQDLFFKTELRAEDFYQERHATIFKAINKIIDTGRRADILLLADTLEKNKLLEKCGGRSYLAELCNAHTSETRAVKYALTIKADAIRRRLIEAQQKNQELIYDFSLDIQEVLAQTQKNINEVNNSSFEKDDIQTIVKSLETAQLDYAQKREAGDRYLGLSCGLEEIDQVIDGLRPGHIWSLGAFTSTGKTQLALNIIHAVLKQKIPCSIISLEMGKVDTAARLIGIRHNISSMGIIKGFNPDNITTKIEEGKGFLYNAPLQVHRNHTTLDRIKTVIRKDAYQLGAKVFVVDYIQNILGNAKEYDLMTKVATELQALAGELQVTIVMVSQISNEAEKGQAAGAGFKGSGAIEAVADLAIRLKRDKDKEDEKLPYVPMKVIITKNRHGFTGLVKDYVMYLKSGYFTKFINLDYGETDTKEPVPSFGDE